MKAIINIIALISLIVAGCASNPPAGHLQPGRISVVQIGMTRAQVIQAIGQPESTAADTDGEVLYYVEERPWWQWARVPVRLKDGKVVAFGEGK